MTILASNMPASRPVDLPTPTALPASVAASALLADSLVASMRRLARQEHRALMLLREFDLHRAYAGRGARSTPDWLRTAQGASCEATRERLRVAYALLNLPRIDAAFASGALSYAKARALAGTATASNEDALLAQAAAMDESQLGKLCAGPSQTRGRDAPPESTAQAVDSGREEKPRFCFTP